MSYCGTLLDIATYFRQDGPVDIQRLARRAKQRREDLDNDQIDVVERAGKGLSLSVLSQIENARNDRLRPATLRALDRGLRWVPGSSRSVTEGGEPTALDDDDPEEEFFDALEILRRARADLERTGGRRELELWQSAAEDVRELIAAGKAPRGRVSNLGGGDVVWDSQRAEDFLSDPRAGAGRTYSRGTGSAGSPSPESPWALQSDLEELIAAVRDIADAAGANMDRLDELSARLDQRPVREERATGT